MSQSPVWPAQRTEPDAAAAAERGERRTGTRQKSGYARLSPLQTAAAMAVIVTSLVLLANLTGVFSTTGYDDPTLPGGASRSPLRSSSGPVPPPVSAPGLEPVDMITEVDTAAPALRLSPSMPGAPLKNAAAAAEAAAADASAAVSPGAASSPANSATSAPARSVPVMPAPPQRSVRRVAPQQEHQHRVHPGKTREQVIEELMQAKRDGSYRALQENYR